MFNDIHIFDIILFSVLITFKNINPLFMHNVIIITLLYYGLQTLFQCFIITGKNWTKKRKNGNFYTKLSYLQNQMNFFGVT